MENPPLLKKAFSGRKIFLAVLIGLSVSVWMLYNSLSQEQYEFIGEGAGTHEWVDANHNNKVDWHNEEEFKASHHGGYHIISATDALLQIQWAKTAWLWIAAALIFMVGRDFFYVVRIRLLTKKQLSRKAGWYTILLWEFASALSPGSVGGAAAATFILNRETIPFGKATAIVIITTFLDNLFFILMVPLVFIFIEYSELFPSDSSSLIPFWFWLGFGILLFFAVLFYLSIFWFPYLAKRVLLFVFRLPFLKRWSFIVVEWGNDIAIAAKEFKSEPSGFWIKAFGATFMSWISRYLVINALMNAFLNLGFLENMTIIGKQLVLWLIMLVSPTPGGSGVAEYAFGELLSSFSSSMVLIVALAVLWRGISYFPYLFIGLSIFPSWLKRVRGA